MAGSSATPEQESSKKAASTSRPEDLLPAAIVAGGRPEQPFEIPTTPNACSSLSVAGTVPHGAGRAAVDGGLILLGVEFDAIGLHNSMMRPDMAHGHSGAPGAEVQSQGPTATSTPR